MLLPAVTCEDTLSPEVLVIWVEETRTLVTPFSTVTLYCLAKAIKHSVAEEHRLVVLLPQVLRKTDLFCRRWVEDAALLNLTEKTKKDQGGRLP